MTAALHDLSPAPPRRRRHLAVVGPAVRRHDVAAGPVRPTDLPTGAPPPPGPLPRVALVGPALALVRHRLLSDRWLQVPDTAADLDVLVVHTADPAAVRALHDARAARCVLAVLPDAAGATSAVALLEAGADACVRGTDPREVAAHLTATTRRLVRG